MASAALLGVVLALVLLGGKPGGRRPLAQAPENPPTEPSPGPAAGTSSKARPKKAAPATPPWQSAWEETHAKARALVAQQQFGQAIALYEALVPRFEDIDLLGRVKETVAQVESEAAAAYSQAEAQARRLLEQKKFAEARALLQPAAERYGLPQYADSARKLLGEIEAAEKAAAQAAKPPPAPEPPKPSPELLAAQAELQKHRQRQSRWQEALKGVEERLAAWDFRGALAEVDQVHLEDDPVLAARLAARRQEIVRMGRLKARILGAINRAEPRLDKRALLLKGINGPVTGADEEGITAEVAGGKAERHAWGQLSEKSLEKVLGLGADGAEDWVAGGLLALAARCPALAERCFAEAAQRGAKVEEYAGTLAEATLARADEDLRQAEGLLTAGRQALAAGQLPEAAKQFSQAETLYRQAGSALAELESKSSPTAWYRTGKAAVEAARQAAQQGAGETQAESLYLEAVGLLAQKELYDLKPLVERLKSEFGGTLAVSDATRKPPFAELEKAVANLGKRLVVRRDGKGDFSSIQAAIDAAPANTLIEIQDNGPYSETLAIRNPGLTLRGTRGSMPIITSQGLPAPVRTLVNVEATGVTFRRLVFLHANAYGPNPECVHVTGSLRLESCILLGGAIDSGTSNTTEIDACLVVGYPYGGGPLAVRNSIWIGGGGVRWDKFICQNTVFTGDLDTYGCTFEQCTITGRFTMGLASSGAGKLVDSIVATVSAQGAPAAIEHCDIYGNPPFGDLARPGKNCIHVPPMFRDPANLDYRLMPGSPCIGKASDGGDLGCRYTPEMVELCKVALELRRRGIIKF